MLSCRYIFAAAEPSDGKVTLRTHKPVYFLILDNKDVKFELSFKVKLASSHDFYFGYTQKSFWDLFEKSSPFRESNYNPEIFWAFREGSSMENGWGIGKTSIGVEHESNGMGGADSRSWNRLYIEQSVSYNPLSFDDKSEKDTPRPTPLLGTHGVPMRSMGRSGSGAPKGGSGGIKDFLIFSLKLWPMVQKAGENKDITGYQGYGELSAEVNALPVRFFVKARKGTRSDAGSVESSLALDIPSLNVYPFVQYWYGHGESLLRYNEFERRWGIGVMMRM